MEREKTHRDARPNDVVRAPTGARPLDPAASSDRSLQRLLSEREILSRLVSVGFTVARSAFIDRARAGLGEVELVEAYLAGTHGQVIDEPELLTWTKETSRPLPPNKVIGNLRTNDSRQQENTRVT